MGERCLVAVETPQRAAGKGQRLVGMVSFVNDNGSVDIVYEEAKDDSEDCGEESCGKLKFEAI